MLSAPLEVLAPAAIPSLVDALCQVSPDKDDWWVRVSLASKDTFDADYSPLEPVFFGIGAGGFVVAVKVLLRDPAVGEADVGDVLAALLARHDYQLHQVDLEGSPGQVYAAVKLAPATRGQATATIGDAYAVGCDALALLQAVDRGGLGPSTAADLLRARRTGALLGLPESAWLEAKSRPYQLRAPEKGVALKARIELAQDVARFANGGDGGLLVIGLKTVKSDGVDTVDALTPAPLVQLDAVQHRDVIDGRVFPPVQGLVVETVDLGGGEGLLFVLVPAQPEETKPFLVHGAIVGERVEGAFISIVERRGEGSVPTSGQAIHATLVAGRAWLRGAGQSHAGQPPPHGSASGDNARVGGASP